MTVSSQVKQTLAGLKGSQGTLRAYANQVQDEETKAVYQEAIEVTSKVIEDLEKRLQVLELEEPQFKGN